RTRKAKITIPAIHESVAIAKSSANSNRPRGNRLTNTSTMMTLPRAGSEYMAGAPGNTTRPDCCNDCKAKFMVGDMVSILPVRRVGLASSLVQRVESFDDAPDGKGCENGALANAFEPLHQNKRQHSRDHHERPINKLFLGAYKNSELLSSQ